ncbi:MAG TPA: hypothetical protein VEV41_27895 [Terriglobales bacterium]|nr:hypothetical protein [Terriglobales bacterium]
MATPRPTVVPLARSAERALTRVAAFPGFRALAWDGDVLYASYAYTLLRARMTEPSINWEVASYFRPAWWRNLSASTRLTSRLFGDGIHALAILGSGHIVGAVPGAIITLAPGETEFRISHDLVRGARPLHITATPDRRLFWGEHFDNPRVEEVHIYASEDRGMSCEVAYTFPKGTIRNVQNVVYDEWENCLWVLTGDDGAECRIVRASCDFKQLDIVLSGNEQARAVALIPMKDALYFSSNTLSGSNRVYRLDRAGDLTELASLSGSSLSGCQVGDSIFFSTVVEPSDASSGGNVYLYCSRGGQKWQRVLEWEKDYWPAALFQHGKVLLPDGKNTTGLLALATEGVKRGDLETTIWRV